jgi:CBS domain containing-hemolysin-like protein
MIIGMVTFEDVIEQLLQGDIEDETDHIVRMKHNEEEEKEVKEKEKVRSCTVNISMPWLPGCHVSLQNIRTNRMRNNCLDV